MSTETKCPHCGADYSGGYGYTCGTVGMQTSEACDYASTLRQQLAEEKAKAELMGQHLDEIARIVGHNQFLSSPVAQSVAKALAEEMANSAKAKSCPVCLGNCIQSTSGDCCRACKGEGTREAYEDNLRARLVTAEAERDQAIKTRNEIELKAADALVHASTLTSLLRRAGETVTEFVAYYPHGVNPSLDAVYGEVIELLTEITAALEGKPLGNSERFNRDNEETTGDKQQ